MTTPIDETPDWLRAGVDPRIAEALSMLIDAEVLTSVDDVQDFIAKPWKWTDAVLLWQAFASPFPWTDQPAWQAFTRRLGDTDT